MCGLLNKIIIVWYIRRFIFGSWLAVYTTRDLVFYVRIYVYEASIFQYVQHEACTLVLLDLLFCLLLILGSWGFYIPLFHIVELGLHKYGVFW